MKRYFPATFFLILLVSCLPAVVRRPTPSPVSTSTPSPSSTPTLVRDWWRDAVFYEIFVRSYYDTNGDGVGDLNGITQKLDYLQSLGVDAIWLMPIHPSPSYHGYDVTDYYAINPQYGSMEDFKRLVNEAHRRDMRIIIDLVLNHTSDQHPWFLSANGNPQLPTRDWYLWSDQYPSGQGSSGGVWHKGKDSYYYGYFSDSMPDLNYRNPQVTEEMLNVVRFWQNEIGVDGFRIDAAKHLIEEKNEQLNTKSTHDWFRKFYSTYKTKNPQTYTVGEVAGAGGLIAGTYTGDQMDQVFNFELANAILNSTKGEANSSIASAIQFSLDEMPSGNFATFLTNHDQNRVLSVLDGNSEKAKVAASILLTAPGTPYIYYGEEIGMQGKKPDEDIRLPMQWTSAPGSGFSIATPWRALDPNYPQVNVAIEAGDPDSLLNHYRTLLQLRHEHSALRTGSITLLETHNPAIYAILRSEDSENILIVVNLGDSPVSDYELTLNESLFPDGAHTLTPLFGTDQSSSVLISNGIFVSYKPIPTLDPYHTYILSIE